MDNAFRYFERYEDETESEYPYKAKVTIIMCVGVNGFTYSIIGWSVSILSFLGSCNGRWLQGHYAWI